MPDPMTAPFDPEKQAREIVKKGWMKAHDVDSAQRNSIYYAVGDRLESLIAAALRDAYARGRREMREEAAGVADRDRSNVGRAIALFIRALPIAKGASDAGPGA